MTYQIKSTQVYHSRSSAVKVAFSCSGIQLPRVHLSFWTEEILPFFLRYSVWHVFRDKHFRPCNLWPCCGSPKEMLSSIATHSPEINRQTISSLDDQYLLIFFDCLGCLGCLDVVVSSQKQNGRISATSSTPLVMKKGIHRWIWTYFVRLRKKMA